MRVGLCGCYLLLIGKFRAGQLVYNRESVEFCEKSVLFEEANKYNLMQERGGEGGMKEVHTLMSFTLSSIKVTMGSLGAPIIRFAYK